MTNTVSQSFIKYFESDVHLAYQQQGSKLRSTIRTKDNIVGATAVFQKVGKGTASTKARHGLVPVMNVDHSTVECTLYDYYAGDWVDSLDEIKTNTDERKVLANAGAYALGRKTDELIINSLSDTTTQVGDYTTGLSKELLLSAFKTLNENDIPDDGGRFAVVGPHQWNELLNISEFAGADFVGDKYPWLNGTESRKWLGIVWTMHTGLPLDGVNRDCFIYHKTAIGHASGQNVKTDISWHGDHAAHFVSNSMSQGSCLIDAQGVVKVKCKDDAVIA